MQNDALKDFRFPSDFLWGAATASYQVEGGIENNDWAEGARAGLVPPCGIACDHYNRYQEDFDIASSLGHTAHRFSLEWSRIEPAEGQFDHLAILHYKAVIKALKQRNIKPLVTIWHWTIPTWLAKSGGVERKDFPELFARYAAFVVDNLKVDTDHFATLNEPYSIVINGWLQGEFPPFRRFSLLDKLHIKGDDIDATKTQSSWLAPVKFFTVANILARAHNLAYTKIKSTSPEVLISIVFQVHYFRPAHGYLSKAIAWFQNWHRSHRFLRQVYQQCDELGINYYFSSDIGSKKSYPKTDMGWDSRPGDIYSALLEVKRYNLPIYVTEAGCADADDKFRGEYIKETVRGIHRALAAGLDIRGFMYWSLLDNYEWAHGFAKRFGLVEINYQTQERKIRPSAYVYKQIISDNGVVE
jgi:beta-glucosidase